MIFIIVSIALLAYAVYSINKTVKELVTVTRDLIVIFSKQSSTLKKEMANKGMPTSENYFSTSDIPDPIIERPAMRTLKKNK